MKPDIAIVQPAAINVDLCAEQIIVALADVRAADTSAARHEQMAGAARETAALRRLEVGRILLKVRPTWPASGPKAKGWSEFLARVNLDDSTAVRYMDAAKTSSVHGRPAKSSTGSGSGEPNQKPANVSGGSGETDRGTWCTSKLWADRVGPWDLDPFSNPRSHVVADRRCMLEDGGNGLLDAAVPGSYSAPPKFGRADETTRVWIQPPYSILEDVIAHYGHTRFCALLRLDSSTEWFAALWERTQVIALAKGTREFFEPPPGVVASTNPQPHALYYANPRDITPAIAESCIVLSRYQAQAQPALQIVR